MSATDAFWTLRILPRIGSSAWYSLSRASLAVPSAESPSTMNSSLRSTSSMRQSASLAGSDEVSSAFLRRWVSLCGARGDARLHLGDDLLEQQGGLRLVVALGRGEALRQLLARRRWRRSRARPAVPSTSLVWPSNCGSARRTVSTAVRPARMSSFSSLSLPDLEPPGVQLDLRAQELEQRLLEARPGACRPSGVAMMLTKLRITVS